LPADQPGEAQLLTGAPGMDIEFQPERLGTASERLFPLCTPVPGAATRQQDQDEQDQNEYSHSILLIARFFCGWIMGTIQKNRRGGFQGSSGSYL
jgi:hypothetical protein